MTVHLTNSQLAVAKRMMANRSSLQPSVGSIYDGGTFSQSVNAKHKLFFDFGYPALSELEFYYFYYTWRRNGFASGLVEKTKLKTWQDNPTLRDEDEKTGDESQLEMDVRRHFDRIRFWQKLQETDKRSMVGKYAGLIFQLNDGRSYDQPVRSVPGGIKGLISVLPAWEGQLEPSGWDGDPSSATYGQPKMFRFNESSVDPEQGKVRSFSVHPDRCFIWSADGTTWGESKLEPIYNALMDTDKVRGAGAEGFWKVAKNQPVLQAASDVDFNQLASMLGTDLAGLPDALDEVIARWTKGFDESLVLQGMEAKALDIRMPTDPEKFQSVPLQEIAAAWPMPMKVLTGMQTGERASTEDAREWAQICMSRRNNLVIPNVMEIVHRFERWGILPEMDWWLDWADLTAPTIDERLAIGERMAKINQHMASTGEPVFSDDEIRGEAGYDAKDDGDFREMLPDDIEPGEEEVDPEEAEDE